MNPLVTCPDEGVWRAWLDGEVPEAAVSMDEHLPSCPVCTRLTELLTADADVARALLATLPAPVVSPSDLQLARERADWRQRHVSTVPAVAALLRLQHTRENHRMTNVSTFARWRVPFASMAAALVAVVAIGFTPQGQSVASAFLAQFRSERLQPISLSASQTRNFEKTFEQLDNLGTVQAPKTHPQMKTVASLAEASQAVGFPLKQPATLPSGVSATPKSIQVMPSWEVRFTFNRAKAQAYYQAHGNTAVNLPAKFDGATLIVNIPAAVLIQYPSATASTGPSSGGNGISDMGLVVGQANELTAGVEGNVSLDELRDFILALPGLDADTVAQLKAIQDWRTTLPIPIPANDVLWQQTTVAGVQGLLLNDNSGLGSAAIWRKDGHIYGVGAAIKANEITKVADGLR